MNIFFPECYDDLFEFECEAKGCILNLNIKVDDIEYILSFYDIVRLVQDAQEEINKCGFFQNQNIIILEKVNKINIINYFSKRKSCI